MWNNKSIKSFDLLNSWNITSNITIKFSSHIHLYRAEYIDIQMIIWDIINAKEVIQVVYDLKSNIELYLLSYDSHVHQKWGDMFIHLSFLIYLTQSFSSITFSHIHYSFNWAINDLSLINNDVYSVDWVNWKVSFIHIINVLWLNIEFVDNWFDIRKSFFKHRI